MALEAADIQDSAIMAMSKQETNDAGKMKFIAALPSGRELSSEFFYPGRKRDALLAWLPAVRSAILADDEEARAQARRKTLELPPVAEQRARFIAAEGSPGLRVPAAQLGSGETDRMEPLVYVQKQRQNAHDNLTYWTGVAVGATGEMEAARAALTKWSQIEQSIGGMTSAKGTDGSSSFAYAGGSRGNDSGADASAVRAIRDGDGF